MVYIVAIRGEQDGLPEQHHRPEPSDLNNHSGSPSRVQAIVGAVTAAGEGVVSPAILV
jgi:hypothetical protein